MANNDHNKQKALAEEILADARRQARRNLDRARRTADRIVKSAESQVEEVKRTASQEAKQKLERQTKTVTADIPHQEQVRTLKVKGEVLGQLFSQALETLKARKDEDVLADLVRLSSDAICLIQAERFVLELAPAEAQSVGDRLVEETAAEVKKTTGRSVTVRAAESPAVSDGGVVVRSDEPRGAAQMIDNSFVTRMRRIRPTLRGTLAEMIFGDSSE